ncbi:extracellular solute-binding protein [Actinomyces sp. HMT897]|jgi:extracellular solute-binding protein family 1|uniref:ABC transporter substrate-binding protein n=1 Tax=Actinomyces sp. HMT897 TaxID=2789424 RepID=UPI0019093A16|nr:extracellular solute-binding protein [Actinomyces sp. HMT897]QQO78187.1 extracellular solute-binding protein [Actinomyces sp. HMT897]
MTRTPWTLARRSFLLGAGLTALAACSSPAGVGGADAGSTGVTGGRTGKELLLYLSAGHDYQPYLDVIRRFETDKGVKVTVQTFQWSDLQQKLTADFLSGDTADLVEEPGGFWATRFGADGNIMSLNGFLEQEPGFLDDFVPAGVQVRQAGGATYAVPLHVTMGGLVFANQDMLQAAGVQVPTTWEEFRAAARAIVAGRPVRAVLTTPVRPSPQAR